MFYLYIWLAVAMSYTKEKKTVTYLLLFHLQVVMRKKVPSNRQLVFYINYESTTEYVISIDYRFNFKFK